MYDSTERRLPITHVCLFFSLFRLFSFFLSFLDSSPLLPFRFFPFRFFSFLSFVGVFSCLPFPFVIPARPQFNLFISFLSFRSLARGITDYRYTDRCTRSIGIPVSSSSLKHTSPHLGLSSSSRSLLHSVMSWGTVAAECGPATRCRIKTLDVWGLREGVLEEAKKELEHNFLRCAHSM